MFLFAGPNVDTADRSLIWEHGRRNFQLRADGVMNIVGPMTDGEEIQGIFTYRIHTMKTFPGDALG